MIKHWRRRGRGGGAGAKFFWGADCAFSANVAGCVFRVVVVAEGVTGAGAPCLMGLGHGLETVAGRYRGESGIGLLLLGGFRHPRGERAALARIRRGAQGGAGGKWAGRITSVRWSERLQKVIGMAVVPIELAEEGSTFDVKVGTQIEQAVVRTKPFFDPEGAHLRS